MGDTTAQMETLKVQTKESAEKRNHEMGPYKEFAGGAVNISLCNKCNRFAVAEIYPTGSDSRGSALTLDCGGRKVENSI